MKLHGSQKKNTFCTPSTFNGSMVHAVGCPHLFWLQVLVGWYENKELNRMLSKKHLCEILEERKLLKIVILLLHL